MKVISLYVNYFEISFPKRKHTVSSHLRISVENSVRWWVFSSVKNIVLKRFIQLVFEHTHDHSRTYLVVTSWRARKTKQRNANSYWVFLKLNSLILHWLLTTLKFLIFRCVKEGEFLKSVSFLFRFCIPELEMQIMIS